MSVNPEIASNIFVAFDFPSMTHPKAQELLPLVTEYGLSIKVGTDTTPYTAWVPAVETAQKYATRVFVDLKAYNTSQAIYNLAKPIFDTYANLVDVHACADEESLVKFLEAREKAQDVDIAQGLGSLAIGITVPTTKSERECEIEYGRSHFNQSRYYAEKVIDLGYDGVVCAGTHLDEFNRIRSIKDKVKIVPAVRDEIVAGDDQVFTIPAAEALAKGALIVVGRSITQPPSHIGSSRNAIEHLLERVA